ncbi:carbon-nitrogen hydrolase family protein [Psychromonas sp. psych-6C06]|uniref:carbon-nitrogen hydrolase family protein n=1 Tax=Psychromonas sp. psych-6C06 TaxID=2058089 RepID=UPI000C342265|nr:carbon-nitrogen hydrolase family protein [Psychromonas sp. psych-6C06]PKF62257.1 carbon-nitrogen hydrolase family protein [Psychromonas sp. psych-6C06]
MSCKIVALQLVSESDPISNLQVIDQLLSQLNPQSNDLVLLPENAICFADKHQYLKLSEDLGDGTYQTQLAQLAIKYQCYLVCGSFPVKSEQKDKIFTTTLVFSPAGLLISHYHKIHLFDALVSDEQGAYKESDTFTPGKKLQTFDWVTDDGCFKVGLAICYDLRFPSLFQALREAGSEILLLPAAFTQITGKAHWQPLLQARAIENQCYVVAANQGGIHAGKRHTYGHSMIISPWGDILEKLEMNPGFVSAPFSHRVIKEVRSSMPITAHNRFISVLK